MAGPPAPQEATQTGSPGWAQQGTNPPTSRAWRHLAVIPILARASDEALVAPLASRALGLGEGLLEGVLLGVHLVIEELGRQLCPIANFNLNGARQQSPQWWDPAHHPRPPRPWGVPFDFSQPSPGLLPDAHLECHLWEY